MLPSTAAGTAELALRSLLDAGTIDAVALAQSPEEGTALRTLSPQETLSQEAALLWCVVPPAASCPVGQLSWRHSAAQCPPPFSSCRLRQAWRNAIELEQFVVRGTCQKYHHWAFGECARWG